MGMILGANGLPGEGLPKGMVQVKMEPKDMAIIQMIANNVAQLLEQQDKKWEENTRKVASDILDAIKAGMSVLSDGGTDGGACDAPPREVLDRE